MALSSKHFSSVPMSANVDEDNDDSVYDANENERETTELLSSAFRNYVFVKSELDFAHLNQSSTNPYLVGSEPALIGDECVRLSIDQMNSGDIFSLSSCTYNGNERFSRKNFVQSCMIRVESSHQSMFLSHPRRGMHKFSASDIREQHAQVQKRYRPVGRHNTDPVDFDGVLEHIGQWSWWRTFILILICIHLTTQTMFNFNIVYMMYQPDYLCKVPSINKSSPDTKYHSSSKATLDSSPNFQDINNSSESEDQLHQLLYCYYHDREPEKLDIIRAMPQEDAVSAMEKERNSIVKCSAWQYTEDVMELTVVTEWNLVCDRSHKRTYIYLFHSFGYLLGCFLGGMISDSIGRKAAIIGFGFMASVFGLFLPLSTYFPMFVSVQFLTTLFNEATYLAAYVLCLEFTGAKYRALVGTVLMASTIFSGALCACVGHITKSWQGIQIFIGIAHFLGVTLTCFLPESARWLISRRRFDEAGQCIRQACREPPFPFSLLHSKGTKLPCDLEIVMHTEKRDWIGPNQRVNISSIMKSKLLFLRTISVSIVWVSTFIVYSGLIIVLSNLADGKFLPANLFLNNFLIAVVEIPTLIACISIVKLRRKTSQMVSFLLATTCLVIAAVIVVFEFESIALIFVFFAKIFMRIAIIILHVFTFELYPTVIRNGAMAFHSVLARLFSDFTSQIVTVYSATLSIVPVMIYSVLSVFAMFAMLLLPETCECSLPETLWDAVTFAQFKTECERLGIIFGRDFCVGEKETQQKEGRHLSTTLVKQNINETNIETVSRVVNCK